LLALGCSLILASPAGEREVPLTDYFTGYRQSVLQPELLPLLQPASADRVGA
jgi:xanthine dehydrogenase small subunit